MTLQELISKTATELKDEKELLQDQKSNPEPCSILQEKEVAVIENTIYCLEVFLTDLQSVSNTL